MSSPAGFWRRQFVLPPTGAQTLWDVLFGIALPVGCLAADLLLFRANGLGKSIHLFPPSLFGPWWMPAYTFILTEVGLLGLWILLRRRLTRSAAFFTGPLLAGCVFSFLLAVALLPLSMVGLLFIVGILGFSPWLTTFAFYRNWKLARLLAGGSRRVLLTLAGIVFAVTPAILMGWKGQSLLERPLPDPSSSGRWTREGRILVRDAAGRPDDGETHPRPLDRPAGEEDRGARSDSGPPASR